MDKRNEAIERYLDRIRKEIYNLTPVDQFIDTLRQDLYEYEESNPECTEEDLESEFGLPEEIAKEFLDSQDAIQPRAIAKKNRRKNVIIAILIILAVAAGWYIYDLSQQQQTMATDVIVIYE